MRTIVVGGGLIGLTTAHALLERGQDVTLLEAREGVALETSFANGGMLTPSLPEPWNGPGVFGHLLASLFNPRAAMKLRLRAIPSLLRWGIGFLRHSSKGRHVEAAKDNYRLARYSLEKTLQVSEQLALEYDFSGRGTLCIYRDADNLQERLRMCEHLAPLGLAFSTPVIDEVLQIEPLLEAIRDNIAGAIWLPDDARGDAHLFCRSLADAISAQGGNIRTGVSVTALQTANGKVNGVATADFELRAERVVVCAGVHSPALLRPVGIRLPVQPAKGYSITVDGSDLGPLPDVAIQDDALHAVITTFGKRIRVVGTAEFTGFDKSLTPARIDNLFHVLDSVLPELSARANHAEAERWAGLRPLSNDGRPFIGATNTHGLFVNSGHGALGWTMAMGSANLLADLVTGRTPAIDAAPFRVGRQD